MRLGDGVSSSETGQYQQSLSTMSHIASDVAQRRGIGVDESMAHLMKAGIHGQVNLPPIVTGAIRASTRGLLDVSASASVGANRTSTSTDRSGDSFDSGISARESADFNAAFSHVQHFVKNHHFDDSQSTGASLSNQLGADLRGAEIASKNYDASMARTARISQAASYVKSQGDQVTKNLEQEFPAFVASRVGAKARDELFSHPGDAQSNQTLQALSHDFLQHERDVIISNFDRTKQGAHVDSVYQKGKADILTKAHHLDADYKTKARSLTRDASDLNLGLPGADKTTLETQVNQGMTNTMDSIASKKQVLQDIEDTRAADAAHHIEVGRKNAMRGMVLDSSRNNDDKQEAK
jgi:conjugal transfer mating pair stabilization protein TraG